MHEMMNFNTSMNSTSRSLAWHAMENSRREHRLFIARGSTLNTVTGRAVLDHPNPDTFSRCDPDDVN